MLLYLHCPKLSAGICSLAVPDVSGCSGSRSCTFYLSDATFHTCKCSAGSKWMGWFYSEFSV